MTDDEIEKLIERKVRAAMGMVVDVVKDVLNTELSRGMGEIKKVLADLRAELETRLGIAPDEPPPPARAN
jgi:hypothetical protein